MTDRHQPLEPLRRSQLALATARYNDALSGSDSAVRWLLGRGLTRETVDRFQLGYVAPEVALPEHGMYRGMIAIPFLSDYDRHPVMLRFRCIEEHDHRANGHGKYNSMPGEANRVFNSPTILEAAPSEVIHVCEGEVDAMTLEQLGHRAVAITGANAFKKHHAIMLEGVPRVCVWGDGDKAGHEFTASVLKFLRGTALGVGVPDSMDVNDLYLAHGREAIDELIKKTLD